jgi:hypothetical protein
MIQSFRRRVLTGNHQRARCWQANELEGHTAHLEGQLDELKAREVTYKVSYFDLSMQWVVRPTLPLCVAMSGRQHDQPI